MLMKGHAWKAASLRDLIRVQRAMGDKPAVILGDDSISFHDLSQDADRIGNGLLALGLQKGDVVACYMHNSIDLIRLWFGCAKIGAIWAPINIALVQWDLTFTINEADARMVVVDHDLLEHYQAIRADVRKPERLEVVRGDAPAEAGFLGFEQLVSDDTSEPDVQVEWHDPAGLIFTGGSTGMPKAVCVPNGWYFGGVGRYVEMFHPTEDDVHLGVGPMYHAIGSAVDVLAPFYVGMTTVKLRWYSASRCLDIARRHNCTISIMVAAIMLSLLAQPEREDDADNPLRVVAGGTGTLPRDVAEQFKARFKVDRLEIYGQTETGPLGCINQRTWDRPYHSLGTGNGWVDIMIGDEKDLPCPPNVVGQILLRPRVPGTFMIGYHNRPDKTVEVWQNLWFHSGDLGRLDENGYLHFEGRMAHLIRHRGENIAAIEVEKAIQAHPAVQRCGVVGVPGDLGDEDVKAWVQLHEGQSLDPLDLVIWCEDRIAYFKIPRYVEVVDSLPLSASKGEIERHKLAERGIGQAWDRNTSGYKLKRVRA